MSFFDKLNKILPEADDKKDPKKDPWYQMSVGTPGDPKAKRTSKKKATKKTPKTTPKKKGKKKVDLKKGFSDLASKVSLKAPYTTKSYKDLISLLNSEADLNDPRVENDITRWVSNLWKTIKTHYQNEGQTERFNLELEILLRLSEEMRKQGVLSEKFLERLRRIRDEGYIDQSILEDDVKSKLYRKYDNEIKNFQRAIEEKAAAEQAAAEPEPEPEPEEEPDYLEAAKKALETGSIARAKRALKAAKKQSLEKREEEAAAAAEEEPVETPETEEEVIEPTDAPEAESETPEPEEVAEPTDAPEVVEPEEEAEEESQDEPQAAPTGRHQYNAGERNIAIVKKVGNTALVRVRGLNASGNAIFKYMTVDSDALENAGSGPELTKSNIWNYVNHHYRQNPRAFRRQFVADADQAFERFQELANVQKPENLEAYIKQYVGDSRKDMLTNATRRSPYSTELLPIVSSLNDEQIIQMFEQYPGIANIAVSRNHIKDFMSKMEKRFSPLEESLDIDELVLMEAGILSNLWNSITGRNPELEKYIRQAIRYDALISRMGADLEKNPQTLAQKLEAVGVDSSRYPVLKSQEPQIKVKAKEKTRPQVKVKPKEKQQKKHNKIEPTPADLKESQVLLYLNNNRVYKELMKMAGNHPVAKTLQSLKQMSAGENPQAKVAEVWAFLPLDTRQWIEGKVRGIVGALNQQSRQRRLRRFGKAESIEKNKDTLSEFTMSKSKEQLINEMSLGMGGMAEGGHEVFGEEGEGFPNPDDELEDGLDIPSGDEDGMDMGEDSESVTVDKTELSSLLDKVEMGEMTAKEALDKCCGVVDELGGEEESPMGDTSLDVDEDPFAESSCGGMWESIDRIAKLLTEDPDIME